MEKPLQSQLPTIQYNYYDYIDAWTNIFLYQTKDFSHSWSINFDKRFRPTIPAWFPKWWSTHGPTANLLPETLMQRVNHFQSRFNRDKFDVKIPLLIFMAKYKIPWILKWGYEVKNEEVYKVKSVKWRDKFNQQRIIEPVLKEFPIEPQPIVATQSLSEMSPSSSLKGKAKSSKSCSSEEKAARLEVLAQQLLAQAAQLQAQFNSKEKDDQTYESSDASSQHPVKPEPNSQSTRWVNYQDPQDPFA